MTVEKGWHVADFCAAPGGKSTQLAARVGDDGFLLSNEISLARCKTLAGNIERLGVKNAVVTNVSTDVLASWFSAYFDLVVVDAPCSGEGMFRKNDQACAEWSPKQVTLCADRQLEILENADRMLAPGGRLVYSTCTFAPEENEGVLVRFLRKHPEYRLAVYGNGDGKEALQRHIREAGLEDRVDLSPSCPDVHRRILDAAMFVSSSDYEGLSNSMLEAMAIGLPTVCTDCPVGGARMVIRDGENGLLVPVGDREALAAAMCRVADDRALAETLSQNGRTLREKLSIGVIADEWERLIT